MKMVVLCMHHWIILFQNDRRQRIVKDMDLSQQRQAWSMSIMLNKQFKGLQKNNFQVKRAHFDYFLQFL